MNMRKILLSIFLVLVSVMNTYGAPSTYKGKCGKNVKWKYIVATQTLYIYGNGPMDNYGTIMDKENARVPWNRFSELRKVVICDGVTAIGSHAFSYNEHLERVSFPEEKKIVIGFMAFCDCEKLDSVVITSAVSGIGLCAFQLCRSLKTLEFQNGVEWLGAGAFGNTPIERVILPKSLSWIAEPFLSCDSLYWIDVDKNNPHFASVAGQLCSKDSTTLYALPNNEARRLQTIIDERKDIKQLEIWKGYKKLWDEEKVLSISSEHIRKIASYAIYGLKGAKHLVVEEGIEELEDGAISGRYELLSIYLPSTLKYFYSKGGTCIGVGGVNLQQVFVASENPEQLLSLLNSSNYDPVQAVQNGWFYLTRMYGNKNVPIQSKWYVPESVYDRYKGHPCWSQLKLVPLSKEDFHQHTYWIDQKNQVHYLVITPIED